MFNIDEVHAQSDLIGYVERAGAKLEKTNNRYSCACVLHGGDNENAFSIYFDKGRWKWHCFTGNCGTGDAITFVELWMCGKEPDKNKRFKLACEWILGKNIDDAPAMYKSAEDRLEEARIEEIAARERKEARIKELQVAEKHLEYHKMGQWAIDKWIERGLDVGMQDFFTLGACPDFTYKIKDDLFHTPTLSIPYFGEQYQLLNIQHRLLNPKNPNDKYRPDTKGTGKIPDFLCIPTMGYTGSLVIVVEGAIKSMVTWSRLTEIDIQVIGVNNQTSYRDLIGKIKNPIIIPDPKGNTKDKNVLMQPYELAKATNGKILDLPLKVDDCLIESNISANDFYSLIKQARKV